MRFLLLFLSLALSGCNSANQTSLVTPDLADVQRIATSPRVTQALESDVSRRYGGIYRHEPAEALVQATLQDLIRAAGVPDLPQSVILLDSPVYNALALPNGQLFVTRGMLALANDRAELAAALAHELGHVISRHSAQRIVERARANADVQNVARIFGDPDVVRATAAAHQQSLAAFSRDKELEADRIGVELLSKAGYDPHAALRILQSLDRMGTFYANLARLQRRPASPLATHPPTPERVAATRKLIEGTGKASGRTDRERYLATISGISFGESGRAGFVRGRSFFHRGINIAITMPQGYVVQGFPEAVGGIKQGGKTVVIFRRMADGVAGDPEGALRRLFARNGPEVTIGPLPAGQQGAMASTNTPKGKSKFAIVVVGGRPYRLFITSTAPDAAFDRDFSETLGSLRTLSQQDERIARPLNLRIVRAEGPVALGRYAAQTGDGEHGVDLLLAINGLRSSSDLRPGSQIKVLEPGQAPALPIAQPFPVEAVAAEPAAL